MEIIHVPDILIYRGGSLHSLRGQHIVKGGELLPFDIGSGIVSGGKLYVLNEEDYVVRMTTGERSVTIGYTVTEVMTINWGDGVSEQCNIGIADVVKHQYTDDIETHVILIKGTVEALTWLYCQNNLLLSLDVTKGKNLKGVECYSNQLTSLDVTHNVYLEYLKCDCNQLITLDISQNTLIEYLYCRDNKLAAINISSNSGLRYLNRSNNPLNIVDLSNSLPDRSGKPEGYFYYDKEEVTSIESICMAKNWKLITV